MKAFAYLALAGGVAAGSIRGSTETPSFEAFTARYGKKYSAEEASLRRSIYEANVARIRAHNAAGKTWTMGVNKFADLSANEWRALRAGGRVRRQVERPSAIRVASFEELPADPPASWDWRSKGAVTPVKDQGQCGSCWAFSTTVATEGAHALASNLKSLISLSEQQIVSCDINNGDGNDGCNGGDQMAALQWLIKQEGQCAESNYPYTSGGGANGKCKKTCTPAVSIKAAVEVPARNETALMAAIAQQPVALSVDASSNDWQLYSGGVYSESCKCNSEDCLDHGVGGVGYGTDATAGDYWIVKNSWSADWGMKGYILLGRGEKYGPAGQCGVQIDSQWAVSN